MPKPKVGVHNVFSGLVKSAGDIAHKDVQHIPDQFFDDLKEQRDFGTKTEKDGYMKVASIPAIIVNKWFREGFDIYNAPAHEIEAKLRTEGYEKLFATSKRVFVK